MKKLKGATLIELLWAFTASIIIFSSTLSLYWVIKKQFLYQARLLAFCDTSRIIDQLWLTVIRAAVYKGCLANNKINLTPYVSKNMKPGTQGFSISYIDTNGNDVIKDMEDFTSLYTTTSEPFFVNDELMISDCHSMEFFKVRKIVHSSDKQRIITYTPLNKLYKKFSQVSKYHRDSYYIGSINKLNNENTKYALYQINSTGKKTEIITGVHDLTIKYTIIKEGKMIEKPITNIDWDSDIRGISIVTKHNDLFNHEHETLLYNYVAIR